MRPGPSTLFGFGTGFWVQIITIDPRKEDHIGRFKWERKAVLEGPVIVRYRRCTIHEPWTKSLVQGLVGVVAL